MGRNRGPELADRHRHLVGLGAQQESVLEASEGRFRIGGAVHAVGDRVAIDIRSEPEFRDALVTASDHFPVTLDIDL